MKEDPAYAMFSLVDEITDRLTRRENVKNQWENFVYENREKLWPDIFGQYKQAAKFCLNWQSAAKDVVDRVKQVKDGFGKIAG